MGRSLMRPIVSLNRRRRSLPAARLRCHSAALREASITVRRCTATVVVDVRAITTGHRHRHRDTALAQRVEDPPVALGQAIEGQLQAAQPIALVRIGAGQVERQVGRC